MKSLKLKMNEQKGFTLVELLAVIVILGIIAAIAVPSVSNLVNQSRNKATIQEGIQIINAAKLYVLNENPTTTNGVIEIRTVAKTSTVAALTPLDKYLENVKDEEFTVTATSDSNGKWIYSLSGHDSVKIVNGNNATSVTEKELINYKND